MEHPKLLTSRRASSPSNARTAPLAKAWGPLDQGDIGARASAGPFLLALAIVNRRLQRCAQARPYLLGGTSLRGLARHLERFARHVIVLRGGQSEKQRSDIAARLAAIPQTEERVIVATGRYLGEGFDDSRLDTLFLTMPIAWKGTLAQYAGRLHRLHDAKREVIIYDYVDMNVPVLARMAAKRRVGYQTIGYRILGAGDLFSDQSVASEASGQAPATFSV